LGTVLLHEVQRFNILIKEIVISLTTLNSAIKGETAMSTQLEAMYNAFLYNRVSTYFCIGFAQGLSSRGIKELT